MGREKTEAGEPIPIVDPTEDLSNSSEDRQKQYDEDIQRPSEGEEPQEDDDEDDEDEDEDDEEKEEDEDDDEPPMTKADDPV